ncbi:molybdopterin converting factor subunit 1 [Flexibacterium corallicola]|uniref:molybdopterin converting factor subunit 1 n=1 Tax=Flexibacterium corallicola TaxID=3037259 RepID=UPI00286EB561|nr:molybdopterin converting factor subunit 1 [Pseudovibrio sp. M1P-2-3]
MSTLKIVYFAWIRERTGTDEETLDLPEQVVTPKGLMEWLIQKDERYAYAFEDCDNVRVALDQEHVEHDQPLAGASEIAFFPPMTGG